MEPKVAAAGNTEKAARRRETIVDFDPLNLRAPFFMRCGAAIIDYLLVISFPVCGLVLSRSLGNDGVRLINSEINNFAWLLAILVAVCDLVLLPWATGQSVGKLITGLRIVGLKGETATVRMILVRQIVGYILTLFTAGLGFFFSVFSPKGRALHDYAAGTIVVYGRHRVRS